jgi:hypothetical protein
MIGNLKIDQAGTFAGLVFLSCEPKRERGSQVQATTKDGLGKWTVEVLGAVRTPFGTTSNEVIKVGMASRSNPAEGITSFSPVWFGDLEVGVMEKTRKDANGADKIIGVSVWFRASEITMAQTASVPTRAA